MKQQHLSLSAVAVAVAAAAWSGPLTAHPDHQYERTDDDFSYRVKLSPSASTSPSQVHQKSTSPAKAVPKVIERPPMTAAEQDRLQKVSRMRRGEAAQPVSLAKADADPCKGRQPEFSTTTGQALVNLVTSVSTDCVRRFFRASDEENARVYTDEKLVTVADALKTAAATYPGNNSTNTLQLLYYLRAGLYYNWQFANSPTVKPAVRAALDALFASPRIKDVSDVNGDVYREALFLISNSLDYAHHLPVLVDVFNRYDASWNTHWSMNNVMTAAQTVLYDASNNKIPDFVATIPNRGEVADALFGVYQRNKPQLGTYYGYIVENSIRELGRLLGTAEPMKSKVRAHLKTVLSESTIPGPTAGAWLEAAGMANYFDKANCSDYGICNYTAIVEAKVLSKKHECSPTLKIRAQELNPEQMGKVCAALAPQEAYFHERLKTHRQPVAGDLNAALELVIFHSSTDYRTYSGTLFDNATNNGGIYLEGDSAVPGNQARFIAYEAEWARPKFEVWNLTHEYTHYLDGRFDMKGDYWDYVLLDPNNWESKEINTVWWMEGLAEYISIGDHNPEAVTMQKQKNMALSYILKTPRDPWDEDRVYRGGYLAARFMFERHFADVQTILGFFRAGKYGDYQNWLEALGTKYDAEFTAWFADLASGNSTVTLSDGVSVAVPATAQSKQRTYQIDVPFGTAKLQFKLSGGTGEADLYARAGAAPTSGIFDAYSWSRGNDETINVRRPQYGKWYVGAFGRDAFSGASIVANLTAAPTCQLEAASNLLPRACVVKGIAGETRYFAIWLPRDARNFRVETNGGSGDADLYVGKGFYPNAGNYTEKSTNSGSNSESIFIKYPYNNSYYYVTLTPKAPYSDVSIFVNYDLPTDW